MAIELWARNRLGDGLDSAVVAFVDPRGGEDFAQILLVCHGELALGQLVSPESDPPEEATQPEPAPDPEAAEPPEEFIVLPPRTRTRRRWRFWIRIDDLAPGVHAFDSARLTERVMVAIERREPPVSLNAANREEWGFIETLPAIGKDRALVDYA